MQADNAAAIDRYLDMVHQEPRYADCMDEPRYSDYMVNASTMQGDNAAGQPRVQNEVEVATVPQHLQRAVGECVKSNLILRFPEHRATRLDRMLVALHFCRLCFAASPTRARKVCILAPTVPLVRKYFAFAQGTPGLRVQYVIGDAKVDVWTRNDWQDVVERSDLLVIVPQLFLDALRAEHIWIGQFCAFAFDECQNCIGSHPFSSFLSEYITIITTDSIRLLGLGTRLVKRKVKDTAEQQAVLQRLERALCATVRDAVDLIGAPGT